MDVADRAAAPDVVGLQPVLGDARRYSFFQLVDLIHRLHGDDLERSTDEAPQNERIRFSSTASLGFPGSDVLSAVLPEHEYAPYQMEVSFLGLHGSQSPLPGYYLEDLAWEQGQNTGIRRYFLDFFNHAVSSGVAQVSLLRAVSAGCDRCVLGTHLFAGRSGRP